MTTLQLFFALTGQILVVSSMFYVMLRHIRQDIHTGLEKLDAKIEGVRSDLNRLTERVARLEGMMGPRPEPQEVAATP